MFGHGVALMKLVTWICVKTCFNQENGSWVTLLLYTRTSIYGLSLSLAKYTTLSFRVLLMLENGKCFCLEHKLRGRCLGSFVKSCLWIFFVWTKLFSNRFEKKLIFFFFFKKGENKWKWFAKLVTVEWHDKEGYSIAWWMARWRNSEKISWNGFVWSRIESFINPP